MASIEERVRSVEDRMDSQSLLLTDMRQSLLQFEARVDHRFEQIDGRTTALDRKVDTGLARLDHKVDAGFARLDHKVDAGFTLVSQEIATLRRDMTTQMSTHLRWTAGMMLTGFVAIVGAIVAALVTR